MEPLKLCALLVAGGMGMAGAMPALAQTEVQTGSHIRQPKPADGAELKNRSKAIVAWQATQAFGQCVIQRHRRVAEQIAGPSLSPEQVDQAMRGIASDECLRNAVLRMPPPIMRGAIFTALYRRDFARVQPAFLPEPYDYRPVSGVIGTPESSGFLGFMAMASCVTRAEPAASRALILAEPGSRQENEAFALLAPKLGNCISAGQTIRFSRPILASLIAESLYRESHAAQLQATASASR